MKGSDWMRFCIENRTSKKQRDIMLVKRINHQHEKRLIRGFKEKENDFFVMAALDVTRRHSLMFTMDDYKGNCIWIEYSKKEKRFTNICYQEDGCWHHIFLKHSIYTKTE